MNTYNFNEFIKKVSSNLNRDLMKGEMVAFTNLLHDLDLPHLDAFALMLLCLPPKNSVKPSKDYLSDTNNLITGSNISYSWFFVLLEDYATNIKDIDSKTLFNAKLKIIIKALKIFSITFLEEYESFGLPSLKKKEIEAIQNQIINTFYIHSENLDPDSVKFMFKRLLEPLTSSHISKDSSKVLKVLKSIEKEEYERIVIQLVDALAQGALIPKNTREPFKMILKYKGRVEDPVIWSNKDWQLYWLVYFLNETSFIEFIPGYDINDYIIKNFKPNPTGQFVRKNLITHISRSKLNIEIKNQCLYLDYFYFSLISTTSKILFLSHSIQYFKALRRISFQ